MKIRLTHNIYQSNIYPHCSENLPILHRSSISDYCPLCKGWLGDPRLASNISDTNQEIFNSKNIEALLTLDIANLKKVS